MNANESAWTQIAGTKAIPIPELESALIPVQDFETIVMGADELRSFYITMKGPFLDTFSAAMDERGSLDRDFEAFQLDVGGGLSEYKFPAAFDDILHPKFAGVIHYQESADCVSSPETMDIVVKFDFLLDVYELDEATFKEVATVVKDMLEDEISKPDGLLKEAVAQHGLLLVEDPTSALPSQPLRKCATSSVVDTVVFGAFAGKKNTHTSFTQRAVLSSFSIAVVLQCLPSLSMRHHWVVPMPSLYYTDWRTKLQTMPRAN